MHKQKFLWIVVYFNLFVNINIVFGQIDTVSGYIKDNFGIGISGATVYSLCNGKEDSMTTFYNGAYTGLYTIVLPNYGEIWPYKSGYMFLPNYLSSFGYPSNKFTFNFTGTLLSAAILNNPANSALNISTNPIFNWHLANQGAHYMIEVAKDSAFSIPALSNSSTVVNVDDSTTSCNIAGLSFNTKYFWRVTSFGISYWSTPVSFGPTSAIWSFTTIISTPINIAPISGTINVPVQTSLSWKSVQSALSYRVQIATDSAFTNIARDSTVVIDTLVLFSNLLNNTKYFWRVNATNANGTGAWSNIWNFSIVPLPPALPTLSSPLSGAVNVALNPILIWNSSINASTYRIQVSIDAGFSTTTVDDSTPTTTSKTIGPLISNTAYYWRVNAKNAGGTSAWSMIWSFYTAPVPATPLLSSPANNSINIATSPILSWATSNGASTYRIQVSINSGFTSMVVDDSTMIISSKSIGSLNSSTIYYWRVNAKNTWGTSVWSAVWGFTTVPPVPATPILISPANSSANIAKNPTLMWNSTTGAATYRIQISTNSSFTSTIVDDSTLTTTSKSIGSLALITTYYWRVNAKNPGGTSSWSSVWSFTTLAQTAILPASFSLIVSGAELANGSIKVGIPKECYVSFEVFDIRGRLIRSLVLGNKAPGYFSVNLGQKTFSKGQYFLRFIANDYKTMLPFYVN
jgi:hypothetical protein